jgi:hypothetical protein
MVGKNRKENVKEAISEIETILLESTRESISSQINELEALHVSTIKELLSTQLIALNSYKKVLDLMDKFNKIDSQMKAD